MEDLIKKVNQIQDLFSTFGRDPIEFPKIVVVGTQSSGKSSVLEAIVRRSFLPRGTGMVTRCPLVLQLLHTPAPPSAPAESDVDDDDDEPFASCSEDEGGSRGSPGHAGVVEKQAKSSSGRKRTLVGEGEAAEKPGMNEWGEFLHDPQKRFRMEDICAEIERQTEKMAGPNKGICHQPITLKIFSPHVVNLTLVDLPGIIKVPVGNQPEDIEHQINKLVHEYIDNKLSIILAVVTANTDMATNESLKLAREADPDGTRTLAVVTKLDLMDKGTNARPILMGEVIPVKRGIVGVKNRSQQDIIDGKSIEDALDDEAKFLERMYPDLAHINGTRFLSKKLSDMLLDHIHENLPDVKDEVLTQIKRCKEILSMCGVSVKDKKTTLYTIICEFTNALCSKLQGRTTDLIKKPLSGGALICYYMHTDLKVELSKLNPCDAYTEQDVLMVIRNSSGPTPTINVPEVAFETLVQPELHKMLEPSHQCLDKVSRVLLNTSRDCLPMITTRFPVLKMELLKQVNRMVDEMAGKCKEKIEDLIEQEKAHITYYRVDNSEDHEDAEDDNADSGVGPELPFRNDSELKYSKLFPDENDPPLAKLLVKTNKDVKDMIFLGTTMDKYIKLVAENLQDVVAKTIMCFLVHKLKKEVQVGLMKHLCEEDPDKLFSEDSNITAKRRSAEKKLKTLQAALRVLCDISDGYWDSSVENEALLKG